MGRLVLLVAFALASAAAAGGEKLSSKECEDLGFTGLALCSDCNTFAEYVKDEGVLPNTFPPPPIRYLIPVSAAIRVLTLVSDCRRCCTEESDDSISKITYSGAILEVCMRKLVFYPEIVGFIEEEKDQFPEVKVQYAYSSPPKLIMLDEVGNHKETIRIDNWKREHIRQFLKGKVKPRSAAI